MVHTFRSRINSACLTTTGPQISKLGSNNFNALTNEYGTENRAPNGLTGIYDKKDSTELFTCFIEKAMDMVLDFWSRTLRKCFEIV